MATPIEKIKSLVIWLPPNDIPYANRFLEKRDFEALKDLVKSDIRILEKHRNNALEEQIGNLRSMKAEVDAYLLLLGNEEDDEVSETDFWGGKE